MNTKQTNGAFGKKGAKYLRMSRKEAQKVMNAQYSSIVESMALKGKK